MYIFLAQKPIVIFRGRLTWVNHVYIEFLISFLFSFFFLPSLFPLPLLPFLSTSFLSSPSSSISFLSSSFPFPLSFSFSSLSCLYSFPSHPPPFFLFLPTLPMFLSFILRLSLCPCSSPPEQGKYQETRAKTVVFQTQNRRAYASEGKVLRTFSSLSVTCDKGQITWRPWHGKG